MIDSDIDPRVERGYGYTISDRAGDAPLVLRIAKAPIGQKISGFEL